MWTRRDLNPRPLRCERNDLPLIYEPFSGEWDELEKMENMGFPDSVRFPFSFLEAAEFQDLDALGTGDFCEGFFYGFCPAFLIVDNNCNDKGF